jgi:replicative DNA helicase
MDPTLIEKSNIEPHMFENPALGRIFYELQEGSDANIIADRYKADRVMTYNLQRCLDNMPPTSLYVSKYEREIKNAWKKRQIDKIIGATVFNSGTIDDQLAELQTKIEQIQEEKKDSGHTIGELVSLYKDKQYTERERIGLGFRRIDKCCGGLDRGDVNMIGARPSVGKSAFAAQVAKQMHKKGLKVIFFNLEMADEQIYQRYLASESHIPMDRIRNAKEFIGDAEKQAFDSANDRLLKNDIMIHTGVRSVREIKTLAKGYDVVIVDYLQLVKCRGTYAGNRNNEVAELSRDFKEMAGDLNCVLILLSQLNRESERHKEKSMADLRDSGAIEQDASVVFLLDEAKKNLRRLSIEKCRNGTRGVVYLEFKGSLMQFLETDLTDKDVKKKDEWINPFEEGE